MNESNVNWPKRNYRGTLKVRLCAYCIGLLFLPLFRMDYVYFIFYISYFYRIDCSDSCKLRKQLLENECKQLRRDLAAIEELKKTAEQQSRTYELEVGSGLACKITKNDCKIF